MQHSTLPSVAHRQLQQLLRRCRRVRQLRRFWRYEPNARVDLGVSLPPLALLAQQQAENWPAFIRTSPLATRLVTLLGPIDWAAFPQRSQARCWPGPEPQSPLPYVIALLIRIDQRRQCMGDLVDLLRQQPELAWLAGFVTPWTLDAYSPSSAAAAVPTANQFNHWLRRLSNAWLQQLLDQTVILLRTTLPVDCNFGDAVAFDTKHIIAWVKENNPKAHLTGDRFDKARQPQGDPDCKLGCKRRSNKGAGAQPNLVPPTPKADGRPAEHLGSGIGEFYWGYASGIVVTKQPIWGEFVLAERTDTFNHSDVSFFHPLMAEVERRLGRKPRFGAADAAYDAFYIYDYFLQAGGFAAIPNRFAVSPKAYTFAADGTLLCAAGLRMVGTGTFLNRTSRIEHRRERWACPLLANPHQPPTSHACPIADKRWSKGGCRVTLPAAEGARVRHQLDRHSQAYHDLYNQRTACERLFSQAVALGIERPKLRNQRSIANLNTLIYVALNLRALQRILELKAHSSSD